ncbi:exopolyphosphatase [Bacillus lacus]|uniref:exopolyphosphatase n=1 Tax=Metabacillus lacus TaxID=1983721 RepID=A0A7X2M0W9_9BACI|nr:exopolyphosphatase [Metabacillus lacus]MRX73777.1 exopolyphosphatase [Metabacillus lacus]
MEKYGIIDIGSNTMRLVIFQQDRSGRLKEIENVKVVARLREYLTEDYILTNRGVDVLLSALNSFQKVTRHHKLDEIKCVATATIRQAVNQKEIITSVENKTDFSMRVLSEYEEAYYGYLAVANSTALETGITVDIGGGSTEVTYFENRELKEYHSFPFGAVSLKKQFISGDVPSENEIVKLRDFIAGSFKSLPWIQGKKVNLVGIGGSARNMVQIDQAARQYPFAGVHQYKMNRENIYHIKRFLASLSFQDLQRVEGLSKDRADIIIPAVEVFHTLAELINTDTFILSRKGLRDGIFYEELTKNFGVSKFPNVVEESFYELATDYDINLNHVYHVTKILTDLISLLGREGVLSFSKEEMVLLKRGAFVYNLGQYIDSESSSQHTFYLLANRTIDGLLHMQRLKLALVASYRSKASFRQYIGPYESWFSKEEQKNLRLMGALLKFAYSLNATKRNIVKEISLAKDEEGYYLTVACSDDWQPEQYQVEKEKKHLEKTLKSSINVNFVKAK